MNNQLGTCQPVADADRKVWPVKRAELLEINPAMPERIEQWNALT